MADLTVSSAVDTFMQAASQAAMLAALSITLGGAFTTSGAFTATLTVTGNTNVTLPTSGTLATLGANVFTTLQTITQANANTGILASTGYSLTGSNATNLIDLAGIWNTSGTPTAFKLNITNTASNVASKLIDLQVGGVSAMSLTAITLPVMTIGNASFHTLDIGGIGIIKCNYGGGERGRITFAENVFNIQMMAGTTGDYGVAITNSSLNGGYLSSDIRLNTTVGVFKIEPNPRQSAAAYTGSGHTLLLKGGQAQTTSTGSSGGLVSIIGGAAGGSGNNNGGNVELSGGTSTGSGTIGCIKFGLATNQLIGFWNKTPIVQPTTGITAAAFIANTSGTINDSATFGGYTIGQIAAALINTGILA